MVWRECTICANFAGCMLTRMWKLNVNLKLQQEEILWTQCQPLPWICVFYAIFAVTYINIIITDRVIQVLRLLMTLAKSNTLLFPKITNLFLAWFSLPGIPQFYFIYSSGLGGFSPYPFDLSWLIVTATFCFITKETFSF